MNALIFLGISLRARLAGEDEEGQGLVEYALILLLVAMALVGMLTVLGQQLEDAYQTVANAFA
jgi:pilus assembly protein Flp/PilA